MTPSKELFELIKSMNQTEKSYFKKYSGMHGGDHNSYLVLFDAIGRQKEYDEKKIIKQLSKYGFVGHFAVVKNYLHSRIMDSLESYHRDSNLNSRVRRAITRAEILHRKGLYEQSRKLAEKTKHLALESGLHYSLLEIYSTIDIVLFTEKSDSENLEKLYHKASESIQAIQENLLTHNLSARMVNCYYYYLDTRNEAYLKEADQIFQSPLFEEASRSQTFMGQLRFSETCFSYHYMKHNLKEAYQYSQKIVSLFDSQPAYLKNNVKKYISALNNLFVISIEEADIQTAHDHLLQLEKAAPLAQSLSQQAMFYCFYSLDLIHYNSLTGNVEELNKHLPGLISQFSFYTNEFSDIEKTDVLIHIAISYYYLGNLRKCIFFLNKLRNEFDLSVNPEVQSFFYLFYLIVHHDSGNQGILASSIQSYYRFLRKKKEVSLLEKEIIVLLKKLSKIHTQEKILKEYRGFLKVLEQVEKSYLDKYIFKYLSLATWMESKIQNRPFAEIVREKIKNIP